MTPRRTPSFLVHLGSLLLAFATLLAPASRAEWVVVSPTLVTFSDAVGWNADWTASSGVVSLKMETVTVSGQVKIRTTIVDIEPAPGFSYEVKKAGGLNGTVEIVFRSATCQSKFSFLYKPGLTRTDYGLMTCR